MQRAAADSEVATACICLPHFGMGYEHFTSSKARFALWGRRGKDGLVSSRDGDLTHRKNMGM